MSTPVIITAIICITIFAIVLIMAVTCCITTKLDNKTPFTSQQMKHSLDVLTNLPQHVIIHDDGSLSYDTELTQALTIVTTMPMNAR